MKYLKYYIIVLIILIPLTPEVSGFDGRLKTVEADPRDISGNFTLIAYGGRYADDIETVAFLDKEGDGYTLIPYAPDFDFRIKKGLSGEEAFKESKNFVSFHPAFWRLQIRRIISINGETIGYEIKPLYLPFYFGFSDIIDIYYWLKKEGEVKVMIKLLPAIERMKYHGGNGFTSGSGGD